MKKLELTDDFGDTVLFEIVNVTVDKRDPHLTIHVKGDVLLTAQQVKKLRKFLKVNKVLDE